MTPVLSIVLVEDNDALREATADTLTTWGHHVTALVCAEDLDDTPTRAVPDLYLIDVNLPGENGFDLAKRIRAAQPLAGIILVTARGQLDDRVQGYETGADNYLVKPVAPAELKVCIDTLARRLKTAVASTTHAHGLTLDMQAMRLHGQHTGVALSSGEAVLLAALSRAPGQKLERWQVMQWLDPDDKGMTAANLEMRISALRKKLTGAGGDKDAIRAVRGYGYALCCQVRVK